MLIIGKILIISLILNIFIYYKYSNLDYKHINKKLDQNIPKISVFLPIYNKEKYLKRSIESIQNQTLKNIEIVAVNDFSTDNSYMLLQELAKIDSRIKIINNTQNRGLLFSRAVGILSSKGEYLINLDPDDEFEGPDNLEYLYEKTRKSKIDVVSFATFFKGRNTTMLKCSNFHQVQHQPELFLSAFNTSNRLNDYLIWNKLIKRDVYLKAYEFFKDKIYEGKWNYHEDNIWSILVHKYADSLICSKKLIYIYNEFSDSLMKNRFNIIDLNNLIYRHEMYEKIFNSENESKYLISEILIFFYYIIKIDSLVAIIKGDKNIRLRIKNILLNFLNNYSCSELNKVKIIEFLIKIKCIPKPKIYRKQLPLI